MTLVHWIEAGATPGRWPGSRSWPTRARWRRNGRCRLGKPDVDRGHPGLQGAGLGHHRVPEPDRVDNPFKQDTWLKAISIRPGDRRVAAPRGLATGRRTPGDPTAGHPWRLSWLLYARRRRPDHRLTGPARLCPRAASCTSRCTTPRWARRRRTAPRSASTR